MTPGDENRRSAEERGERDRGHLPVPVVGGVDEVRDVGTKGGRHERPPTGSDCAGERDCKRRREQSEADRPELGKCLHVEAVRIADGLVVGPVTVPIRLVASRPRTEPSVRLLVRPGSSRLRAASVFGRRSRGERGSGPYGPVR